MRNDVEHVCVPRGENDEVTTRVGASNQLETFNGYKRRVSRLGHTPTRSRRYKNGLVHYKNLQQIEVVSSPSVHQTPDPSLLFPSIITAFFTGSRGVSQVSGCMW